MAEIKINMDSLKSFRKTVRHKVKDGNNIYRLLPPFGESSNGYPYQKWSVVWGLKDPTTGNSRPYASPSVYEGKCPVFDYLDLLKAKVEKLKSEMVADGSTPEQVKERFKETNMVISQLRPKTNFAYNAADKSGSVGVLELKSTAHKKVLELMNKYIIDYNQDPTSLGSEVTDSGVWFNVTRTGEGLNTEYGAQKNQTMQKDANNIPSFTDDRQSLPENVTQEYENLGYDLTCLYQKKTYDELKTILVANLELISKDNSDLVVEGFSSVPAGIDMTIVSTTTSFPQGGSDITINLDQTADDGQIVDGTSAGAANESQEDLMKMAEEVFN